MQGEVYVYLTHLEFSITRQKDTFYLQVFLTLQQIDCIYGQVD